MAGDRPLTPSASALVGGRLRLAAVTALLAALAGPSDLAWGQAGFDDFETIGRLEDTRRAPSDLRVGQHVFEPSVIYKLMDVVTPHVFASGQAGWTDNLLRQDADRPGFPLTREPWGRVEAGARLDMELGDHRLELGYRTIVTEYVRSGRFDTFEQSANARLDVNGIDLEGHADVAWRQSSFPTFIQLVGFAKTETVEGTAWGEGRLDRLGLRLGLAASRVDFLEGALSFADHRRLAANVQFYGRVLPKLRALVEYNWEVVRYDVGPRRGSLNDYMLHQAQLGIDGLLTAKLTGSIKLGYGVQDVDPVVGGEDREFQGPIGGLSLRFEALPRTFLQAAYRRQVDVSLTSNYLVLDEVEARAEQLLLEERVSVVARVTYTHAHVRPSQDTNRLQASLSVSWKIRQWLGLHAEYLFERLGGEVPFSDYVAHVVTLSVGVGL